MDFNIISILGRENAGKTTSQKYICNSNINGSNTINIKTNYIKITDIELYIISIIFGWDYNLLINNKINNNEKDPIWNMTLPDAKNLLKVILTKYIDTNYIFKKQVYAPFFDCSDFLYFDQCKENQNKENKKNYIRYSFATPLKAICCVLFDFENIKDTEEIHKMLLGEQSTARLQRQVEFTINYNICKKLNGRTCLEYLGTDVLRKHWDNDIWIKIFIRDYNKNKIPNIVYVIDDTRFTNEIIALNNLKCMFLLLYRNENDLIITETDKKTHIAKWQFLENINYIKNLYKILNDSDLKSLYNKINLLFS